MAIKVILAVEPDPDLAVFVAYLLGEDGYEVLTASTLSEALALLSSTHVDLIVTEALDQRDSFIFDFNPAFLTPLKGSADGSPVILCSTYVATNAIHAGSFDLAGIVSKPFEVDTLEEEVARVLGQVEPASAQVIPVGGVWPGATAAERRQGVPARYLYAFPLGEMQDFTTI